MVEARAVFGGAPIDPYMLHLYQETMAAGVGMDRRGKTSRPGPTSSGRAARTTTSASAIACAASELEWPQSTSNRRRSEWPFLPVLQWPGVELEKPRPVLTLTMEQARPFEWLEFPGFSQHQRTSNHRPAHYERETLYLPKGVLKTTATQKLPRSQSLGIPLYGNSPVKQKLSTWTFKCSSVLGFILDIPTEKR